MQQADFKSKEAGHLIKAPQGYSAFVPAPLPPKLSYSPQLVMALSAADAALSELSGVGRLLPNPHLLLAAYMRREAVLSSRIEGTQASLADVLAQEAGQTPQAPVDDVREVRNYVTALEYGMKRLDDLPLSLRLVCELHERLMQGVRGEIATPGQFRRSQNWIGPPGSTLESATYIPPPPHEMMQTLGEWEKFLHNRGEIPDLIQCALMHEHFEAIHPFLDGNGRVGRLLITLFLLERGRLSQPLLYLSEYIERHRSQYYDGLLRVRTHGDWHSWLSWFLQGVHWSAQRALRQAKSLMELREKMRRKVQSSPKAVLLVDELFINPYIDASRARKLLAVTDPTARTVIDVLLKAGIVEETTGRNWGKQYLARKLLSAIEDPGEDMDETVRTK